MPNSAAEAKVQHRARAYPPGMAVKLGRLHIRKAATPIEVGDQPTSAAEKEYGLLAATNVKGGFVDVPDLCPAIEHQEERRASEYRKEFHEVAVAGKVEERRLLSIHFERE